MCMLTAGTFVAVWWHRGESARCVPDGDKASGARVQPAFMNSAAPHSFMVGIENSAPERMPDGQRDVTVLVRV